MEASSVRNLEGESARHGPILTHYVRMAQVMSDMFAPVLEMVVHDVRKDLSQSIIAIFNGHVTGREVGDPATDVVHRLVDGDFPEVLVGYENESPNGRELKSSCLAVRDQEKKLVGVVGFNLSVHYFKKYNEFISQFIDRHRSDHVPSSEEFQGIAPDDVPTPREDIEEAINQFRISRGWGDSLLSNDKKQEIVGYLYKNGYFKNRGAVTITADLLGLTRASVYNYKKKHIDNHSDQG